MVIWIIGKSGSGKTYFAKKLLNQIKKKKIHIDGDEIRDIFFNNKLGHDLKSRKKNSELIVNLCNFLEKKKIVVVCSILSIFPNIQKKNRLIFNKYFQIYIKTNIEKLKKNNSKKIYSNTKNVVGVDIKFPEPYKSDIIINNTFDGNYKKELNKVIKKLKII